MHVFKTNVARVARMCIVMYWVFGILEDPFGIVVVRGSSRELIISVNWFVYRLINFN